MAEKPEVKLSVVSSEGEQWVLDGGVNVSRRFDFNSIERRPSKSLPRDMSAHPADDRKPI